MRGKLGQGTKEFQQRLVASLTRLGRPRGTRGGSEPFFMPFLWLCMTHLSLSASSPHSPLQARSLRNPDHLVVKVVIVLVLGVQILVLSLVLSVEVLVLSAVLGVEPTVETTVLPRSHRVLVSGLMLGV